MHQWYKEIEKRVEKLQLRVHLYHGPNRESKPSRYERKQYLVLLFFPSSENHFPSSENHFPSSESHYILHKKATIISLSIYIEKETTGLLILC